MFLKDKVYKLVVVLMFLGLASASFFTVLFLRKSFDWSNLSGSSTLNQANNLNMDSFDKIKYRFIK